MKNYILTVIGKLDSEKICKEIALNLTPMVDSPTIKFNHTRGVLVIHFASQLTKIEIYTYVMGVLYDITQTFILTELNDILTVSFPPDVSEHLFDLENDNKSENVSMKLDLTKVKKNQDFCDFEQEDDEDDSWITFMLEENAKFLKRPTLDFILDKIYENGIQSLTEDEKNLLEYYSKN